MACAQRMVWNRSVSVEFQSHFLKGTKSVKSPIEERVPFKLFDEYGVGDIPSLRLMLIISALIVFNVDMSFSS